MLVEAAAGTGKTTCLIARMVSLLRAGKCRIETLAAVTFTRKAAAELRMRFQLALERAVRATTGTARQRLAEALTHVERCNIGTIHSFCARLLRERPVEAGIDPGFVEIDEALDAQLRQQAWREHVIALITTDDPILPELERLGLKLSLSTQHSTSLVNELDQLGLEPAELGPAFLKFAEYSDVTDWPAESVPLPDLTACITEITAYTEHMRTVPIPADCGTDTLLPRYEQIGRMARRFDLHQPAQLMELLEQFDRKPKVVQKKWPGQKAQAVAELERWNQCRDEYAIPLLQAWREHRYAAVMRAIRPALAVYDRLRRERHGLNFQDLLLRSVALLRDKPEVRRYFRERFSHLFVDEFQDTDPIQAEIMLLLTADDCDEQDWERCRPVPGSLFVVGDPKQSIYRFRRADILTYNKVRSIVEQVGGEVLPLSANFRSVAPLIDWINGCFERVFPAVPDDFSPAYRPLEVGRAEGTTSLATVEKLMVPADLTQQDRIAEYEADLIARTIRCALDEKWPVPRTAEELERGMPAHACAGDFLLVSRYRTRLTAYARKFQKYRIPHAVTGGRVLNEVPELELLHLCLTAVVRSDDPVALVAVLRSELFGVADTVLYEFKRLGGRFSYYAELPEGLAADDAAQLQAAFARLQNYARWLARLPVVAALERMAADLGLLARACAAEQGDAHAGSLLKALELLRDLEGQSTIGGYVDALGRIVNQHETYDGIPVRPPQEPPVRVMNLHQCKGLEAPFVFLVDPAGEKDHDVELHIDRSGKEPRGYLAIYGPKRGKWSGPPLLAHPPGWADLAAREQRFLDGETQRLLYVAATRAGVKLVIAQRDAASDKNPWQPFASALAAEFADPGPVTSTPPAHVGIDRAAFVAAAAGVEQRWRAVLQPTYAVQAVKSAAIQGGPKPHGAERGGAEWGELLHTLLEAALQQPHLDLPALAASALVAADLPITLVDDVVSAVERVRNSDLWKRARNATRCYAEAPIAVPIPAQESDHNLPTVLRGVIDLVFQEPQGWVIVDYKSERVAASDIPALVTYYQPQLAAYAQVWERFLGQPVVERGLFFTHTGTYVPC